MRALVMLLVATMLVGVGTVAMAQATRAAGGGAGAGSGEGGGSGGARSGEPTTRGVRVVEIDLTRKRQVMDHFGASDCWTAQMVGLWSGPGRERMAELLFSKERGIGLSMWRFNISAGMNPAITDPLRTSEGFEVGAGKYDWSRQPGQRWFLSAAKQYGVERFLAFANSPPGRLTVNRLTSAAGVTGTTNLRAGAERQFAVFLAEVVEHFAKNPVESERVTFDWLSPVNEPSWDWEGFGQEGCRYSNEDIARVAVAVGGALERRRLPTRVHLVEAGAIGQMYGPDAKATKRFGALYGNYLDEICGRAEVAKYLGNVIGYHSYWSDGPGQLVPQREALRAGMEKYPGWSTWQTEYCVMEHGRDLTMATALRVASVIHADLTVAEASAWSWWLAISTGDYKDGLIYTDAKKLGDAETVIPSKLLWTVGNWSRFVRPGMRRVEAQGEGGGSGLLVSAFADGQTGKVVVVAVNRGEEPAKVELVVKGGSREGDAWRGYVTSDAAGDDLRDVGEVRGVVVVPGRAVMTVVR